MITIRKADYYAQVAVGLLALLSIPALYLYGALAGFSLLGCWQMVSAALNTRSFIVNGFGRQASNYWKGTAGILTVILFCIPASKHFTPAGVQPVVCLGIFSFAFTGIYYLRIYYRLIDHIYLKRELSGFTKSKH